MITLLVSHSNQTQGYIAKKTVLMLPQSHYSLPALWVQRAEDHSVHCVMSPEEQPAGRHPMSTCGLLWYHVRVFGVYWCKHSLPLVVGECDPLCWNFEVDNSGLLRGVRGERYRCGLLNCLMSCQWLQCHRAQIPHVTCCTVAQTHGL